MNKKTFLVALVVIVFFVGYFIYKNYFSTPQSRFVNLSAENVVKMGEDSYAPVDFEVKKGTKVRFVNESGTLRWPASDLHPSHLIYPEFDSKEPVKNGDSWEFEFDKAGEWSYHDHLAPYITGTIKVSE